MIQEETKTPEVAEVKSEVAAAPTNESTFLSDIPTSFDIGGLDIGDTSTNTGANVIPSVLSNESSSLSQTAKTVPSQSSDEVSFIVSGNPVPVDSTISDSEKSPLDVAGAGITIVENTEILPTETPVIEVISSEAPASPVPEISIIDTLSVPSAEVSPAVETASPEKNETESVLTESPLTTLMS